MPEDNKRMSEDADYAYLPGRLVHDPESDPHGFDATPLPCPGAFRVSCAGLQKKTEDGSYVPVSCEEATSRGLVDVGREEDWQAYRVPLLSAASHIRLPVVWDTSPMLLAAEYPEVYVASILPALNGTRVYIGKVPYRVVRFTGPHGHLDQPFTSVGKAVAAILKWDRQEMKEKGLIK